MLVKQAQNIQNKFAVDPTCVLLLHGDGTNGESIFKDFSRYNKTITASGAITVNTPKKFGSGSIYFDGTNDYIEVSNNGTFSFGTGDFTISIWCEFASLGTYHTIIGTLYSSGFMMRQAVSSAYMNVYLAGTGTYTYSWSPSTGVFYNLVLIRKNSIMNFYVNGVKTGNTYTASDSVGGDSETLWIGSQKPSGANYFNGYLDEIAIWNTAKNISDIYPQRQPFYDYAISEPDAV